MTRRDALKGLAVAAASAALPMAAGAPGVLPLAPPEPPEPLVTFISRLGVVTAIARTWEPGAGYCGRCPRERCHVTDGVCLVVVPRFVPDDEAPTFAVKGGAP